MASTATVVEIGAELVVARKAILAQGVVGLTLRDPHGADLPGWLPGAHIDLVLSAGLVRQYSLCGDPADRSAWRIAVLREPAGRGGSQYVHDELREGDKVTVGGLRNNFPLVDSPQYLFIAGGIGITPILAMIAAAGRAGAEWRALYGGRSRSSMAFVDQLAAYGDRVSIAPQDETGLLDLAGLLADPRQDTSVYCCGPEPLLRAVEEQCGRWPGGCLQVERFRPRQIETSAPNGSFEVELAVTGGTLSVPADRSVLEVLESAGIEILSSCREGTCGTCETVVLDGMPEHRDSLLTAEEQAANDLMYVCVSRARSRRLVLEL
jgi:ferredoxin-NADP reductase